MKDTNPQADASWPAANEDEEAKVICIYVYVYANIDVDVDLHVHIHTAVTAMHTRHVCVYRCMHLCTFVRLRVCLSV